MTSYKVLDLQQGSPEWISARYDFITSSNMGAVLGVSDYKTPMEYWEELMLRSSPPIDPEKQGLFAKGHEVEALARDWCMSELGTSYPPYVLVSLEIPELMASLDGFSVTTNTIFEAKYVGTKRLDEIAQGRIPTDHNYQIQAQLLVSGADKCLYFASNGKESVRQYIKPDDLDMFLIKTKVREFAQKVKEGIPPELTDRDYYFVEDPRFKLLEDLKIRSESAAKDYDYMKRQIMAAYMGKKRVKCGDVSFMTYVKRGFIQYGEIPALQGMDLEKFRAKPSQVTKFNFGKKE